MAAALTACGQARTAAPPVPQFTYGERAATAPTTTAPTTTAPTTTVTTVPTTTAPAPDARSGGGADPGPLDAGGAPGDLLAVDDAGVALPDRSAWATFDAELSRRLVPADVSASVAVMVDGHLVHAAAFGERVAGTGEPAETTDRFRIASISKTITAIVTLRLVEAGALTLDDPVGELLATWLGVTATDPDVAAVTVRDLLSHTAGFPKHQGTFFSGGAASCPDAARRGLTGPVSSGDGYLYSNMSYCVLGVLIEAVTGEPYEQVVYEQLLTPLGISGMRTASTYDLGPGEVSHHPAPNRNYMEALGAAGAWNATPSELVAILNSIDPATPGWKALSPATMAAMRYRVPAPAPPSGYGLGLMNFDGGAFGHTGTIEHAHAMVMAQPDGVTWAVTVSGEQPGNTSALAGIVHAALAAAFPVPLPV